MNRDELLKNIHAGRRELRSAFGHYNKHDMIEPLLPNGWSVKDVIAHIGFWERRVVNLYNTLAEGSVPDDPIDSLGLDELNARILEDNQLVPLGIAQVNELEAYQELLHLVETAPEGDLFDPQRFAWTEGEPFYNWIIGNSYGHYADHIAELLEGAEQL